VDLAASCKPSTNRRSGGSDTRLVTGMALRKNIDCDTRMSRHGGAR
jgi:hypothetical protein